MKKSIIFAAILILLIAAVPGFVTRTYPYELRAGLPEDLVVIVFNDERTTSKDSQVMITIPELDIRDKSENFRLKSEDTAKIHFEVEVAEDAKPDYYPVIITFTNDDGKRVKKHSWVYVG